MEWYEILNTCTSILILCTFASIFIFVTFIGPFIANKDKEQKAEKPKENERKRLLKVVVFESQHNLSRWFDNVAIKLSQLGFHNAVKYGLHMIKLENTTIIFATRDAINKTWSTLPKDALYYLTAEYDLNDNFIENFYKILFTSSDYLTVDETRRVLHL